MSFREDIETAIVERIKAADTDHVFRAVKAVGQLTEAEIDEIGMPVPFAVVKYVGASGQEFGGELTDTVARIEVLVAFLSCRSIEARRLGAYRELQLVKRAIHKKKITLEECPGIGLWTGEQGAGIDESNAVEAWNQTYQVRFSIE